MKKINPKMAVEMTLEDANYINELIERDKAKPVREVYLKTFDENIYECPVCGNALGELNVKTPFCRECGQRLDVENIEL